MPDILKAAEWTAKAVRRGAQIAAEQIAEIRSGFSDSEAGDYLACAGADALEDTFGEWGDAVARDEPHPWYLLLGPAAEPHTVAADPAGGERRHPSPFGATSSPGHSTSAASGVAADRPAADCDIPPSPAAGHLELPWQVEDLRDHWSTRERGDRAWGISDRWGRVIALTDTEAQATAIVAAINP